MRARKAGWTLLAGGVALLLASASATATRADEAHAYIGPGKCKLCHLKQYKSWQETKMAQAFELLRPGVRSEAKTAAGLDPAQDYTTDASCVGCHVTGYGQPGGFVSEAETPELAGVTCEVCHGPGGTYVADEYMSMKNKEYDRAELVAVGLVAPPTEAQCVTCHNTESPFVGDDYVFDFESRKDQGTHEHYPLKYPH